MTVVLRSARFRREREETWTRLEELVQRAETRGVRKLSGRELAELATLYRATVSSLSVARAISLDRNLLSYLEHLCQRSYFIVYGTRRHVSDMLRGFLLHGFPQAVRDLRWHVLVATLIFVGAMAVGWALVEADPERWDAIVPPEMAQGRGPSADTETLRKGLYDGDEASEGELGAFSAMLFANNAQVGILAFAIGIFAGIPVFLLLGYNGLLIGAFSWLFHSRGLGADWWGWVLPHGVTELGAIVLCGGAGLALAQGLLFPGARRRLDSLAHRGRQAGTVVLGSVLMLLLAGIIEGVFRQRVQDMNIRYTVVFVSLALWLAYFIFGGRGRDADGVRR